MARDICNGLQNIPEGSRRLRYMMGFGGWKGILQLVLRTVSITQGLLFMLCVCLDSHHTCHSNESFQNMGL